MKVAVFGQSSIGQRHARLLRDAGQDVLTCDPIQPADVDSPSGVWKRGVEAVVIATPPATHLALMREANARRLPMLVEKPLALVQQREEIRATAWSAPVLVGYQWRYAPELQALLKQPSEWATVWYTGPVNGRAAWVRRPRQGGGVLMEYSHALDLLLAVHGDRLPQQVFAMLGRRESSASISWANEEAVATAYMTFDFPIHGSLTANGATWTRQDSDLDACYRAQTARFLACCRGEAKADGIAQGVRVLDVITAARRSRGRWVNVND